MKVTSGSNVEVAAEIDKLYQRIVKAGTHKASSIKVAEAAKVIENTLPGGQTSCKRGV